MKKLTLALLLTSSATFGQTHVAGFNRDVDNDGVADFGVSAQINPANPQFLEVVATNFKNGIIETNALFLPLTSPDFPGQIAEVKHWGGEHLDFHFGGDFASGGNYLMIRYEFALKHGKIHVLSTDITRELTTKDPSQSLLMDTFVDYEHGRVRFRERLIDEGTQRFTADLDHGPDMGFASDWRSALGSLDKHCTPLIADVRANVLSADRVEMNGVPCSDSIVAKTIARARRTPLIPYDDTKLIQLRKESADEAAYREEQSRERLMRYEERERRAEDSF